MRLSHMLCGVAILWFTCIAAAQEATPWRTLAQGQFNVYAVAADSSNARQVARILNDEYLPLSASLQVELSTPVGVFIAPDRENFDRLTGGTIPHWGEAVADPLRQIIIVKSPRWHQSATPLRITLVHELVHVMLGNILRLRAIPRWFNEGLAIYYSGETSYFAAAEASQAQLSDQLIPLREIDGLLEFGQPRAHLAYQQSFLAVAYLAELFGESVLPSLVHAAAASNDFDAALRQEAGMSLREFEQAWRDHLRKKYRWAFLIEFERYLWIFILLLFILTFIGVMLRRRQTLARWEESEHAETLPPEN